MRGGVKQGSFSLRLSGFARKLNGTQTREAAKKKRHRYAKGKICIFVLISIAPNHAPMRYLTILLGICALLSAVSKEPLPPGKAVFRPGKDHALFFAVNTYGPPLQPLQNPIANAGQIAGELKARWGFDTVVVRNPTAKEIEQKIREYRDKFTRNANGQYPQDGQLFIFFSGHGKEDLGIGYFLPRGTDPNNLRETALSYEYLRNLINAIPCRHVLVSVDACYSVYFDKDFGQRPDLDFKRPGELGEDAVRLANHERYRARVFFTSDAQGDMTPDKSGFAKKMLEGLRTFMPSSGFMTSSELFASYVQKANPVPHAGDFGDDEAGSSFLFFRAQMAPRRDASQDVQAWNEAKAAASADAYRTYLRNFPQGEFRELAEARIRQLEEKDSDFTEWQSAKATHTREAYRRYLDNWPSGAYRELAESALERLAPPDPENMVLIPGGTFQMGSNDGDSDEKPPHSVTLGSFYMGKYEVTLRQFKEFIDASGYKTDAEKDGGSYVWNGSSWDKKAGVYWKHDAEGNLRPSAEYNHPVIHVSWNDATEYCKWLSQKRGKSYRLPTEAEWEYAAGNGSKHTKYSWGNGNPSGKKGGNVADESAKSKFPSWTVFEGYSDGFVYTASVGSFDANELGLFDMTGNVWEWCADWKGDYPSTAQNNPKGPSTGSYRVYRGGSWSSFPQYCRVAYRDNISASSRSDDLGFRLARTF